MNFTIFENRPTPFSRLSMPVIEQGKILFTNLFFNFQVSEVFNSVGTQRRR
jgi:hypothetical protein